MAEGGSRNDIPFDEGVAERLNELELSGSNDDVIEHEYMNISKLCKPCEKRAKKSIAVKFCKECSQYQCQECSQVHSYFDSMQGHSLTEVRNAVGDNSAALDMKGFDVCQSHDKIVEFYCEDCGVVGCSTCVVVTHRQCKHVLEIRSTAVSTGTSNSEVRAAVTRLKDKAELTADHWEHMEEAFNDSVQHGKEKIETARKVLNEKFDRLLKYFESGSTSLMRSSKVESGRNIEQCKRLMDKMAEYINVIDNVSQFGTPLQIFIVINKIQSEVQSTLDVAAKDMSKLKSFEMELFMKNKATLGSLLEETTSPGYVRLSTKRLNVRPFDDELPVKLELIDSTVVVQERNESKEPFLTGLTFLPDGRLVAVDNKNDKLRLFGQDLKKQGAIRLSTHPIGITVIGDEVAVFFANATFLEINFFFIDKNNLISFIRRVPLTEQFSSICVKDTNTFVMTTLNGNKPARMVSVIGQVSDFELNFSDKKYGIDESACAYIRNEFREKLVLLHTEENVINIYDMKTGEKVAVQDKVLVKPRAVAVCPLNSILVSSDDRIIQISPTGRILAAFEMDMAKCRNICVSLELNRLAVTNATKGSKTIKMFKIVIPGISS